MKPPVIFARCALATATLAALLSACSPATVPTEDSGIPDVTTSMDATPGCPMGQMRCGGQCIDVSADRRNCGACGNACNGNSVCSMGVCAPTCPSGQQSCGGVCVTTSSNPAHCGACGNACPAGQVCSMSACAVVCAMGLTRCSASGADAGAPADGGANDLCVDTRSDPNHCGACGTQCAAGQICSAGACRAACGPTQMICGARCADLQSDPMNCGRCGAACTGTQSCVMGTCRTGCPSGQMVCGTACIDVRNDPRHCGRCGATCSASQVCDMGACVTRCPMGQTACGDRCIDTSSDAANCGMCGMACAAGQLCSGGMCTTQCVMGNVRCGSRCVDTSADPTNCGMCGTACPAGSFCRGGACATSCTAGSMMCGASCADLSSDNSNCGMCGAACAARTTCVMGTCQPLAMVDGGCSPPSLQCGGVCTDPRSSNTHCGRCGNACAADRTCFNGACVAPCTPGQTRCGAAGTCTDIQGDSANCGRCGNRCPSGESCVTGACSPDPSFRVTTMSIETAMCRISPPVDDFATLAGDQGGGIAVTSSSVFYTGDSSTVFLPASDLSTVASVSPRGVIELLASDLRGSTAYALADAMGGAPMSGATGTITQLRALNSSGMFSGTSVMLSRPLAWSSVTFPTTFGIFSGYGRIIVYVPAGADMGYWQIAMPTGVVTRLAGTMAPGTPINCERGGHYGIAEFFGGIHYIVYMSSMGLVRQQISTGTRTTITATTSVGDVCCVGFSPARNRWYFQYEAAPSWAPPPMMFGEHVVSCPATWELP